MKSLRIETRHSVTTLPNYNDSLLTDFLITPAPAADLAARETVAPGGASATDSVSDPETGRSAWESDPSDPDSGSAARPPMRTG